MAEYRVVNAMKTGSYDSQFGEADESGKKVMYKYSVQLEGQSDPVDISQKPSTAPPKAGDVLSGTIEDTQYGKRFKKDSGGSRGGGGRYDQEGAAWGNALSNAASLVNGYYATNPANSPKTMNEYLQNVKTVTKSLKSFIDNEKLRTKPTSYNQETSQDVVVADISENEYIGPELEQAIHDELGL